MRLPNFVGTTLELWCERYKGCRGHTMDVTYVHHESDFPPNDMDPTDTGHLILITIKYRCRNCGTEVVLEQEVRAPVA